MAFIILILGEETDRGIPRNAVFLGDAGGWTPDAGEMKNEK